MLPVPDAPSFKLRLPIEVERVKLGALRLNGKVVVAVWEPEVPVIVTVLVPTGAEAPVLSVSVLKKVVGFGENEAVTPLGRPATEKFTLPAKPFTALTSTNVLLDVP